MKNQSQNQRINRQDIARKDDGWDNIGAHASSKRRGKRKKTAIVPFLLGLCVILILLGIIIYIFTQSSFEQDGRSIPVKAENKQQEYPVGARKLDEPILGAAPKNNNTVSDMPHGEEFDFSPLENAPLIERVPVLPKKYIKEKEENEFQTLWNDSNNTESKADHLNISKAQYDIMTMTDLKKIKP